MPFLIHALIKDLNISLNEFDAASIGSGVMPLLILLVEHSLLMVMKYSVRIHLKSLMQNAVILQVIRCSRYDNGGRMHVILNCERLEEVDCFKYLGSQVGADGGCERDVVHTINEGYRAWGALKSVLINGGVGIDTKKCLYEGVIVPTALYRERHGV